MASEQHWYVTSCLVISSIIAVSANLLLLILFSRRRGLRSISNRFVINLLITNLLSSVLLVPLLLVDQDSDVSELTNVINITANFRDASNATTLSENVVIENTERKLLFEQDESVVIKESHKDEVVEIVEKEFFANITRMDNDWLCYLAQCSTSLVCTTSIFSILLIGIDQYFAVIHSLRYHSYMNKFRSLVLISGTWLLSVLFAGLGVLVQTDSPFWKLCARTGPHVHLRPEQLRTLRTIYAAVYFTLVILLPFAAICAIYVRIYRAAHRNSERMRKSTSSTTSPADKYSLKMHLAGSQQLQSLPKVRSAPNFVTFHAETETRFSNLRLEDAYDDAKASQELLRDEDTTASTGKVTRTCSERSNVNFISNIKCKISNASIFRYREEGRAAKISILVIFMVLVCYIPYGVSLVVNDRSNRAFHHVSLVLLIASNIVSPFLFAYRNRRVQRELCKFFGVKSAKLAHLSSSRNYCRTSLLKKRVEGVQAQERVVQASSIPTVVVTCKADGEKKSILKRVCSANWQNYKKCNFITVPEGCVNGEPRGSFSSASTQISNDE